MHSIAVYSVLSLIASLCETCPPKIHFSGTFKHLRVTCHYAYSSMSTGLTTFQKGSGSFRSCSRSDPDRFGPIPFRSGRFGPILELGPFGQTLMGRFGPLFYICFLGYLKFFW